jgi:RhtB (resistance to homoserine/threonine) family protein
MSHWGLLGSVVAAHILAMASPGPNVLIVTQTAASQTRRTGVCVALGIATGAGLLSSAALLGLSALLTEFAWLQATLRLAAGTYLLYLGFRLWRGASLPAAFARPTDTVGRTDWRAYQVGLITNLTNPKALVFYGSVFAALLAPDVPLWVKAAAVGLITVNSTVFHVALASLFSTERAQAGYRRIKPWVDRIAGAGLAAFGLHLVLPSR